MLGSNRSTHQNLTYLAKVCIVRQLALFGSGETWPTETTSIPAPQVSGQHQNQILLTDKTIFEATAGETSHGGIYRHDFIAEIDGLGSNCKPWETVLLRIILNLKDVKNNRLAATIPFIEPRHFKATSGYSNSMHPGNNSTDASTNKGR